LVPPIQLQLASKSFSPEQGEHLEFYPQQLEAEEDLTAFLSARVYNVSGELVRVLFEDWPWNFSMALPAYQFSWDGCDSNGRLVRGGIYILTLSAGPAKGSTTSTTKTSVAVIR
jgi:hypothetical protein